MPRENCRRHHNSPPLDLRLIHTQREHTHTENTQRTHTHTHDLLSFRVCDGSSDIVGSSVGMPLIMFRACVRAGVRLRDKVSKKKVLPVVLHEPLPRAQQWHYHGTCARRGEALWLDGARGRCSLGSPALLPGGGAAVPGRHRLHVKRLTEDSPRF